MTPQRHARVKEVFLAACEVQGQEREAFIKQTCGNDVDLQREVEELLSHHSKSGNEPTLADTDHDGTTIPVHRTAGPNDKETSADYSVVRVSRNFPPGKMLGQRFRIVCLLGKGGMGEVYRAEDLAVGQNVALKFLPSDMAGDRSRIDRMRKEVRMARRVTHPHVCRVYDLDEIDGDVFISMEYVEGEDLKNLVRRIGRLPEEKAIQLSREISLGLAAAHAKGIVHRDLKPANIMIDGRGHARIMDFGLAAIHDEIHGAEIRAGTPEYMSPEQLAGREVTPRSDIYALGLVVYELLCGHSAYHAASMAEYSKLKEHLPKRVPSSMVDGIQPEIEHVVMRCLEPDPAHRPASAMTLAACFGGTSLAAAAEAGETLTPEIVAAADDLHDVHPAAATSKFVAFLGLLLLIITLDRHAHPVQRFNAHSPLVLAADARRIAHEAGVLHGQEVFGFSTLTGLHGEENHFPADQLAASHRGNETLVFWYRSSLGDLTPTDATSLVFESAQTRAFDPPDIAAGGCRIILDVDGRLLSFEQNPQTETPSASASSVETFAAFAKISLQSLQDTPPKARLDLPADRAQAWSGTVPDIGPTRIEAATDDHLPIFFAVFADTPLPPAGFGSLPYREWLTRNVQLITVSILTLVSIPIARKSLRRGRSDPHGAFRLATFIFIIRVLSWLLQSHHVLNFGIELNHFMLMLAGAVGEAVVIWLMYVALEPFVRRFWPQTLISWERTLRGRIVDPRVGRDVLAGCLLGVVISLVFTLDVALSAKLGWGSRPAVRGESFFDVLLGLKMTWGFYLDGLRAAIYLGLAFMLLMVLLRTFLKNTTWAAILTAMVISLIFIPRGANEWLSPLLIGVLSGGLCVWAFVSLGLIPIITAFFLAVILYRTPLTWSTQAWYGDCSFMTILFVLALAIAGFALARRHSNLQTI